MWLAGNSKFHNGLNWWRWTLLPAPGRRPERVAKGRLTSFIRSQMKGQRKGAPVPEGAVHILPERILFLGTGIRNAPHRHFTASLSFALDQPFAFREGRKPWRLLRGIAVAPNVQQQMD